MFSTHVMGFMLRKKINVHVGSGDILNVQPIMQPMIITVKRLITVTTKQDFIHTIVYPFRYIATMLVFAFHL